MARLIWTPEAIQHLKAIDLYISRDHPAAASALVDRLIDAMDPVEVYPRIGRVVPEFAREQLRELVVDGYRIIYTIDAQTIWVAAVLHGNMDIAARLRDLAEGL